MRELIQQGLLYASIAVAFVISAVKVITILFNLTKLKNDQVLFYTFNMFFASLLCSISQALNLYFCWTDVIENDQKIVDDEQKYYVICLVTWTSFGITLQMTLSWVTVLIFGIYYITMSQEPDFIGRLTAANKQFLIACNVIPVIINILPFISYFFTEIEKNPEFFDIFKPILDITQTLPLTIPIIFLIAVTVFYSVLTYKTVVKSKNMSVYFKNKIICEIITLSVGLVIIYLTFVTLNHISKPTLLWTQIFQISILSINTIQIPIIFYMFGINCSIKQILVLKLSLLKDIRQSNLGMTETSFSVSCLDKSIRETPIQPTVYIDENKQIKVDYQQKNKPSGSFQFGNSVKNNLRKQSQANDIKNSCKSQLDDKQQDKMTTSLQFGNPFKNYQDNLTESVGYTNTSVEKVDSKQENQLAESLQSQKRMVSQPLKSEKSSKTDDHKNKMAASLQFELAKSTQNLQDSINSQKHN